MKIYYIDENGKHRLDDNMNSVVTGHNISPSYGTLYHHPTVGRVPIYPRYKIDVVPMDTFYDGSITFITMLPVKGLFYDSMYHIRLKYQFDLIEEDNLSLALSNFKRDCKQLQKNIKQYDSRRY